MAQKSKGKILVTGSVVIDVILEREFFGGTGANIAYGLGKLKACPLLFSLAGSDFKKDYEPHLKKTGIDLRVHIDKKNKTANFYCVTNKKEKQVWALKRNAYKNISKISLTKTLGKNELKEMTIAIFSPGTPKSIFKHLCEFRNFTQNAIVIFDPGQEIINFSKKILEKCLNLCNIFIVNETEYKQAKKILRKNLRMIIREKIIIKTKGAKGSEIFQNKKSIKIPAVSPKRIIDTTGAGDAYRAGLIYGIYKKMTLEESCRLGARIASKNIEFLGCRKYRFKLEGLHSKKNKK